MATFREVHVHFFMPIVDISEVIVINIFWYDRNYFHAVEVFMLEHSDGCANK